MKTIIKFLSITALVVMGAILAGCAKELDVNPVAEDNIVICTTTVTLDADDTKALSIEGDKGVKTFAEGEQVALRYYIYRTKWDKAISQPLSKTDISADGKTATLTFTLTDPDKNGSIKYYYPAAMANYDINGNVDYKQIIMQNGTLASLSANLDLAIFSGNMSGTDLPANVTLTNQLAILAITLKNSDGSSDITNTITGLTLSDGTDTYSISRSAAAGPIYVAIKPVNNKNIRITATSGSNSYTKSLTGKTYAAGNGYNVSWRMESAPTLTLDSPSVGQVIGNNGRNYAYASLPSGVTAVAMIAYVSGKHGLAIAMADEKSGNDIYWIPAMAAAAAHTPAFSGGTWKIPSNDEWKQMLEKVNGYENYKYDKLNSKISSAGGSTLAVDTYWTSTPSGNNVVIIGFNSGGSVAVNSVSGKDTGGIRARSCLAF